ncbi:hypothetical protein B0H16DRAFT_971806 [Mycena metata]|uniref:Zn(2)-C6 fungal-type domain-containing protein n=1 Tax=Mycena metata TaxID=1033252 RepID=A0AAD7IL55_9AGAR|nr:hypothetical protein B0H16DRAFT_971806 [Mycena metata]
MSHDDDWSDILADDPHNGSQIRNVPELLKRLDALNIIEKNGAAYLQPSSHNDAGSTAQLDSENHLYALPFLPTQGSYRNEARHKMAPRFEHPSYDIYLELGLRYPEFESKADPSRNIINASSYVSSYANSGYGGSSAAGQHPFITDASMSNFRNAGFFTTSHPREYHNNAQTYHFSASTSPPPLTAASLSAITGVAPPPAPNQGYYLPRSASQSASQGKGKRQRPEPVNNENKDDDMDGDMEEEGGARAKSPGACARCKKLKVKCEFKIETDPCKRCFNGGHDCVTPGRKKRRTPPKREHLLDQIREQAAEIQKLMTQLEETNARHARAPSSVATDAFPLTPSSGGGLHSPVLSPSSTNASYFSSEPVSSNKPESDVAANKAVEDWIAKARDSLAEFDGFIGGAGMPKSYLVKEDLEDSSSDDEDDNDGDARSGGDAPESDPEYWIEVIDSDGEDVTQQQPMKKDSGYAERKKKDSGYAEKLATLPSEASPFGLMADLSLKKSRAESLEELDSSGAPALGVANDNFFRSTPDPMRNRPFDGGPAAPHILTRGLITPQEAEKLFDIYFQRMNLSVSLLDPILYTAQKTCYRSPFLFTVVCAIASRFYTERPELYPQAMHFAELAAGTALISGHKCVELCQGYILLSLYPVPAKHWEEERGWLYLGLAIRMAIDLNLHLPNTAQPINESHAREMLNRTRVWLNCFNLDRSTGSQYGKAPTISNNDYVANHSENWWCSSPFNMANFDIHICAYNSEVKVMSALMAKIYSDPTGLNKNVQVDFQAIATETDEELKQLRDRWRAILDQTDMTDPQNKFRSGLIGLSYSYARLVVLSFGFQDAFEKNHVDENPFFNRCLAAATDVVHTFINEVGSPDQRIYLRHGPIAQSVFATFAASMLVKLLQPKFASYLSIDKQREIRGLVKQVIDLLGSPDVSVDGEHGPNLYARFLEGLLTAPFAKDDLKPSRTPMRSNSGQPMDGGDASSSMRASVDLFMQGGRGLGLEVDMSPPDFFPPSLPYNQDPLQGMQGIVSGWSDDFSWMNQLQNQDFLRTTEGMYNEQSQ